MAQKQPGGGGDGGGGTTCTCTYRYYPDTVGMDKTAVVIITALSC